MSDMGPDILSKLIANQQNAIKDIKDSLLRQETQLDNHIKEDSVNFIKVSEGLSKIRERIAYATGMAAAFVIAVEVILKIAFK